MPRGKPSPKLAITVDPEVHERVVAAAAEDGLSVSAWMTAAARWDGISEPDTVHSTFIAARITGSGIR